MAGCIKSCLLVFLTCATLVSCGNESDSLCPDVTYVALAPKDQAKLNYHFNQQIRFLHSDSTGKSDTLVMTALDTSSYFLQYQDNYNAFCDGNFGEVKHCVFNPSMASRLDVGLAETSFENAAVPANFYINFYNINFKADAAQISADPTHVTQFKTWSTDLNDSILVNYSVQNGIELIRLARKKEKWVWLP